MSFNRVILVLHLAAMLVAFATCVVTMNMERATFLSAAHERVAIVRAAFAFVAVLTGFWSMAARPPRTESVSLAISTVAAVFLLLLAGW